MTARSILDAFARRRRRSFFCGEAQCLTARLSLGMILVGSTPIVARAQITLTWSNVRTRFQTTNPSLQAGQIGIDESKAAEITAYLRPNPIWSFTFDQIGNTQEGNPFSASVVTTAFSYLHEREHKRELRQGSAQGATAIAISAQVDLTRNLLFMLRTAFIQVLQAKALRTLAQGNLTSYDEVLTLSRARFQAGEIAQIDLDRLALQRVTYASDVQTAEVNLRTAKIQLLALLNDRTPVEQFDVTGPFEYSTQIAPIDEVRQSAIDTRPDLKAALQSIDKAKTDHRLAVANGSTDPTFGFDMGRNPPIDQYIGFSVNVPLRIFDRNQGEKVRTQLDVDRNEKLMEATRAQVFSDVDSAYAGVTSTVTLLEPYKQRYLEQASRVRDTISFSYEHGAASLLDFLNAQADYRGVQLNYLNLVGTYLEAANQLNLAVGREVIP